MKGCVSTELEKCWVLHHFDYIAVVCFKIYDGASWSNQRKGWFNWWDSICINVEGYMW